jgi:1-deoxy-D-xylulose-5-phosphate reductoisomerase
LITQGIFHKFECLKLAYKAIELGGAYPAILNAANEVAVHFFLKEKIAFNQIPECIDEALSAIIPEDNPQIEDIIELDRKTREFTNNFINSIAN